MTRMLLDPETLAKLKNCEQRLQLCDESGRPLAILNPVGELESVSVDTLDEARISPEELESLRRQSPGRPLNEILEELETQA